MPASELLNEYLETQVLTAAPERLHLLVVQAAIRNAEQALAALERKDLETAHFSLGRARDCVSEMVGSIRNEPQPELAANLKGLLLHVHKKLVLADFRHEPCDVADALRVLRIHHETWLELLDRLAQESSSQPAAISPTAPAPEPSSRARFTTADFAPQRLHPDEDAPQRVWES